MTASARTIVIAGGGTGGHLFPALATAQTLLARGYRVVLATDSRGRALGPLPEGIIAAQVRAPRMSGGVLAKLRGAFDGLRGVGQARALLHREKAAAVMSFGGYTAVPVLTAARMQNLPIILHELDSILGRTNRLFVKRATRVTTAYPHVVDLAIDPARIVLTGTPVRPGFAPLPYNAPSPPAPIRLFVVGGSQGARVLSDVVPDALSALPETLRARLRVVQQARAEDRTRVEQRYAALGIAAEISSFFTDMPMRIGDAHLVISRSGASTAAELTCVGRPSLLIPYKFAMNDHQSRNAQALAEAGAAVVLAQDACTPQTLAATIAPLLGDSDRLSAMAAAAQALGIPDAAERLADVAGALVPAPEVRRDPFVLRLERKEAA
jgi:UDP-N-acetylglucosamine--N-acetylmuramyl-(pentapeptide) pyrophosphoryl-undecaprenol N-acetylglucosamine transferase